MHKDTAERMCSFHRPSSEQQVVRLLAPLSVRRQAILNINILYIALINYVYRQAPLLVRPVRRIKVEPRANSTTEFYSTLLSILNERLSGQFGGGS